MMNWRGAPYLRHASLTRREQVASLTRREQVASLMTSQVTEQRTTLDLRAASPDTVSDGVLQCPGQACPLYRAGTANLLGLPDLKLRRAGLAHREEQLGIRTAASRPLPPLA